MKKVISTSLYGSQPFYHGHAISFLERVQKHYPGWTIRYYVDRETVPKEVVDRLRLGGAETIFKTKKYGGTEGMFWRFLVADDPKVDLYIIRDVDSLLGKRDRQTVDEWLESGKGFHVIRDHWGHKWEIMGGLWGGRKRIAGMTSMVEAFIRKSSLGRFTDLCLLCDQYFLREKIYPKIRRDLCVHTSYTRFFFEYALPCPPCNEEEPHIGYFLSHEKLCKEAKQHLNAHLRKSCVERQRDITYRLPLCFTYFPPRSIFFSVLLARILRVPASPITILARLADYCRVRWRFCLNPESKV